MHSINKVFENFVFILIFIIPLCLLVGFDYSFVTYDSEPDYIAAAFHINEFGLPFSSHHPGTVTQYLVSIPFILGNYLNFSFNTSIILARFIELAALAGLILYSINLMIGCNMKHKFFCYSLVWLLIFLYPSSSVLFKYVSAEILLFGISFLTSAIWYRHLMTQKNCALIGFVIAVGLNIKSTYIFLIIVLSSFHIIKYAYISKTLKGLVALIKIYSYFAVFFTLLSIPKIFEIMPIMFDLILAWYKLINSFLINFDFLVLILSGFIFCLFIFLFYLLKSKEVLNQGKSNLFNIIINEGWIIFIPVTLFVFYKLYFYFTNPEIDFLSGLSQWESLGIIRRNSIPLYAFMIFFIVREVYKKIKKIDNLRPLLFSFLFTISGAVVAAVSSTKPLLLNKDISLFDRSVMSIIEAKPEAKIYIHHDNYFDSVLQFYLWSSIRYGNCNSNELKNSLKASHPELTFGDFSYVSINGVSKCKSNIIEDKDATLLNRWLGFSKKVDYPSLCSEFESISNEKIFLIDSRYVDNSTVNELLSKLNINIADCGFNMILNNNYFSNNEIFAYDIKRFF